MSKTTRRGFLAGVSGAALLGAGAWAWRDSADASPANKDMFEVTKTPTEWKARLTKQQYYVLRDHGTERAYSSPLNEEKRDGIYHCAGCDLALYSSEAKFDSGTGWPSFYEPLPNAIGTSQDRSFFMTRTEVHCRRCGGHLGHVFEDGPPPTGLRYCMNGVAMTFAPGETAEDAKAS